MPNSCIEIASENENRVKVYTVTWKEVNNHTVALF